MRSRHQYLPQPQTYAPLHGIQVAKEVAIAEHELLLRRQVVGLAVDAQPPVALSVSGPLG
jgi:hypothetical protein